MLNTSTQSRLLGISFLLLHSASPFTTHRTFTTRTPQTQSQRLSQTIQRRVSTLPDQDESAASVSADSTSSIPSSPLFDLDSLEDGASTYQVQDVDMSSLDIDIDVDYEVEYGDDDDLYSTNIDNDNLLSTNPNGVGRGWEQSDSFERDQDDILAERESRLYVDDSGVATKQREKCILVGVEILSAMRKDRWQGMTQSANPEEWEVYFSLEQSMDEMKELISTSGMELVGIITQRMNDINPKTYIGTGKVLEAQELMSELDSCTVVFDAELSPGQQKTLENAFNKEVIQNDFMGSERAVSL